ncbi:hypothetical protein [Levilactobacillus acidifarinae]|nr:hypothetical protein [Levilactobacillus acidifarinae]GEO68305.1 hypothetical protein LAC03_02150 [Levilactobacillus acidifarinae]
MQMHKSINIGPSGQLNHVSAQEKKAAQSSKDKKQALIKAYLDKKRRQAK